MPAHPVVCRSFRRTVAVGFLYPKFVLTEQSDRSAAVGKSYLSANADSGGFLVVVVVRIGKQGIERHVRIVLLFIGSDVGVGERPKESE